jgi:hypothetical protein
VTLSITGVLSFTICVAKFWLRQGPGSPFSESSLEFSRSPYILAIGL